MTGVPDPATSKRTAFDPSITQLDLRFLGVERVIAAYLVDAGDELVLIETGPTTTLANLERAIEATGRSLGDVTRIVVTHIHLDHSGAAGVIVRKHPHIRVAVHPVGAPHLVDPERLVRSAGRIYGDDMERLWGEIAGVPGTPGRRAGGRGRTHVRRSAVPGGVHRRARRAPRRAVR